MSNEWIEASAPGRLDVMGGIADYSGSLVLQKGLQQQTTVQLRLRTDGVCTIESTTAGSNDQLVARFNYADVLSNGVIDFDYARRYFQERPELHWVSYVAGCILVLEHEHNIKFSGADIKIKSDVPLGKGVSSSASLEVAMMKALVKAFSVQLKGTTLPLLAQRAENLVVGAPCGLMDQLASYFGNPGQLLPILCQPDIVKQPVNIPAGMSFIGIDSGVRHAVGGSDYANVRCAAFMGYAIILHSLGVNNEAIAKARQQNKATNLPFRGYLSNIPVEEFQTRFQELLPASMPGKAFVKYYGTTTDPVTAVNEDEAYNIFQCTAHPVYEHARVNRFLEILNQLNKIQELNIALVEELGTMMFEAHESYSRCGLGSSRTNEIVDLAKEFGGKGIAGAKITGGGSGGTVCLLAVGEEGRDSARQIHGLIQSKYGEVLALFE